jgi:hypothetical protein
MATASTISPVTTTTPATNKRLSMAVIIPELAKYGGAERYLIECVSRWQKLHDITIYSSVVNADLLAEHLDVPMDFGHVQAAGSRLGTGTMVVLDDRTCPVGMVLSLEAGLFSSGVGSLQIERTLLVTPGGSEALVRQDRTQPVRPEQAG